MSDYGVELRNAADEITYSTEMSTWNYIDSFIAQPGVAIPKPYPILDLGFDEVSWFTSFIGLPSTVSNSITPKVPGISRAGSGISVDASGTVPVLIVVLAR